MKRTEKILLVAILTAALLGAAIFTWPMLQALAGPEGGLAPAIIMIVGSFVIGGALMFLLFYSSRRGHDEEVHRGGPDENGSDR